VEDVRHDNPSGSTLDVRFELEGCVERGMDGARHHPIDPPVGRPFVRLTTIEDGSEGVSLPGIRPLVDDGLTLAVALVDRSREGVEERSAEAIECRVSEVTLIDPNNGKAAAVSVCGPECLELARTSVIAVAIAELDSFDVPVNLCHLVSSFKSLTLAEAGGEAHPRPKRSRRL
jgi:hypothetical protein